MNKDCPELDKMLKNKNESFIISQFLEWLEDNEFIHI